MGSEKLMNKGISENLSPAIWALTPKAVSIARRLMSKMGCGKLFTGPSIEKPPSGAVRIRSLSDSVGNEFHHFQSHIFIMAVGIVVRMIAPFVKSKLSDPAVVVVDDQGRFAVSLLSGHLGGANELASKVAEHLKALPVITTATDVRQVPAIDMLAKKHGLRSENPEAIKTVHMAVLKGRKVMLHDPMNILQKELSGWTETWIDDYNTNKPGVFVDFHKTRLSKQVLVLRPKILSVGVGCNRGTGVDEIYGSLKKVFLKFGFSINSINNIATIDAKADEQGILELSTVLNVPIKFFSRDQLERVGPVPTPSEVVKKHMGVASICEAAAILAANQGKLLVPKQVMKNMTVAVGIGPSMSSE